MATKIQQAGLTSMAITFLREGLNETQIAQRLTQYCLDNEVKDDAGQIYSFSQSTVNRELKEYRNKYRTEAQRKLNKLVNDQIESDYDLVQEAKQYLVGVARDAEQAHPIRERAWMNACKVTFDQWKSALGGGDEADTAELIADEIQRSLPQNLRDKLHAITAHQNPEGVSGPH